MALTRAIAKPTFFVVLLSLGLFGCSQTNIAELVKAHAANPRAYCAILNAGPYGGGTIAAGSPDVSVTVSASGCEIVGANVTKVMVPTGSITVTPTPQPK
jgi:hypothetical protein